MSEDQQTIHYLKEIIVSLQQTLASTNEMLASTNEHLVFANEKLASSEERNESLLKMNQSQANELSLLREQLAYFTQKMYGRSSEKTNVQEGQVSLFDLENSNEEASVPPIEEVEEEVITYKRKKSKGKRQMVLDQLPVQEKHYVLEGEACQCPNCANELKAIGKTCYRQEVVFIPAQLKRVDHIQHAYKCHHCSQQQATDVIVKAPVPKAPIDHSFGSASVIAHSMHQKFNLKVPNYRQEEDWLKLGLPITRKEITNWHLLTSERYLEPLYNRLKTILVKQSVLHADETTYRVLESDTEQTYYWVFLSEKESSQAITYYHHDQSRGGKVVQEVLGDYQGYLHCDRHHAYRQLESAKLVGCWAHVRRYFYEATPKKATDSLGAIGLGYCNRLFKLEEKWYQLTPEERYQQRHEKLLPIMDQFFDWCRQQHPLKGSKLQKAIDYALNHERVFRTVLEDGQLVLSNNLAERAIKAMVMGRKNWLFSQSFEGAKSTAIIMTIIETAKRHQLDTERYLAHLLEHLPNEPLFEKNEVLEAYLPWDEGIQKRFRMKNSNEMKKEQ